MTELENYFEHLTEIFRHPLPGKEAHLKFVPGHRRQELIEFRGEINAVKSGVLILLFPSNGNIKTVLIQRPKYDGPHSGQISFPGGKMEVSDLTLQDTALRESREEVGIDPEKVRIHGHLSELYIPPSNYIVLPVVGSTLEKPDFVADPAEVESILELNLSDFLNPESIQYKEVYTSGKLRIEAPCYYIDGKIIWGATAMIISELVEAIKRDDVTA